MDNGRDAQAKIVRDKDSRLVVAWSIFKDLNWNAQVLLARSTDREESFSEPRPVSPDPSA